MKRKLITQLLQNPDPAGELQDLLKADGSKDTEAARAILAGALEVARTQGQTDPQPFYHQVCSSMAEQLMEFIKDTPAGKFNKAQVIRAQSILNNLLTSKAGRPASSNLPRNEQLAIAQRKRRETLSQEGRKQVNEWVSSEAANYLNAIKEIHGVTRAEALDMILTAAFKGQLLTAPPNSNHAKETT